MYTGFYNLSRNPFRLTPDPAFLYVTEQHQEALAGLVHSICNHSGLTVLSGEAGTGKTTLLQVFKGWLVERRFVVAMVTNPTLSRTEFYDLLLAQLGVRSTSDLKSRQLLALEETLTRFHSEGRRPVLIVDEAHGLSPELLEEIRLLLNMETPKEKLLQITLAGQQELDEILRQPEWRQLKQRISGFCKLGPLTLAELRDYIQHRLAQAQHPKQDLFPGEVLEAIHKYTEGIPRLINSLCDSALHNGFALQAPSISMGILREAARDMDLLKEEPVPPSLMNGYKNLNGSTTGGAAEASRVVEGDTLEFLSGLLDRWK